MIVKKLAILLKKMTNIINDVDVTSQKKTFYLIFLLYTTRNLAAIVRDANLIQNTATSTIV